MDLPSQVLPRVAPELNGAFFFCSIKKHGGKGRPEPRWYLLFKRLLVTRPDAPGSGAA